MLAALSMQVKGGARVSFTDDEIAGVKDRNPVDAVAGQWVTLRRKGAARAGAYVGPCPICSDDPQSKSAGRFECDADGWLCAVCADGGDVIKLMRKREGLTFVEAVERLGGTRAETITPAVAARAGTRDFRRGLTDGVDSAVPACYAGDAELRDAWRQGVAKAKHQADYADRQRTDERDRLRALCAFAAKADQGPRDRYLAGRGLLMPANARLRCHPSIAYRNGKGAPVLLTGPAMLAPILSAGGAFWGLHTTWIDPAGPKGKAMIVDPETGEIMPSKKVRGTKAGGYIDLGGDIARVRMFAGEGIETVLAVYTALVRAARLRPGDCFRSGVDLGNLAGRAVENVRHPTLKTSNGSTARVPGSEPDLASPAMPVPDSVEELVLLGDGDSDPFLTHNALERAKRRSTRPGRVIRNIFAPAGRDFSDLLS